MATAFDYFPEREELLVIDDTIVVDIDSVEEFNRRNLSKLILPMLNSFVLINLIAAVLIEYPEDSFTLLLGFVIQFLLKQSHIRTESTYLAFRPTITHLLVTNL